MLEKFSERSGNQMFARIIKDSISEKERMRITTFQIRCPRIIWPEILTHRVFGRNARSSRAVPIKKMIEEVRSKPFVPWHWTGNKKGMQGTREYDAEVFVDGVGNITKEEAWIKSAQVQCDMAEAYADAGFHKQVANRLLEPFMYIDGLITSVQWNNFFWLRDHEDAEPHLEELAGLMFGLYSMSVPEVLKPEEWHLPYITQEDIEEAKRLYGKDYLTYLLKFSSARCARISYTPFNGNSSPQAELERYDLLVKSERVHASPLEHQAKADVRNENGNWKSPQYHGNLPGYIQARKLVENNFIEG